MLDDLKRSGAPKRSLVPLAALSNEASERDAKEFNVIRTFSSMTLSALEAQRGVLEALSNPEAWLEEEDDLEEGAASAMEESDDGSPKPRRPPLHRALTRGKSMGKMDAHGKSMK